MIESLKYIITDNTIPYYNLALEKYLLFNTKPNEMILYLWQNKNTIVIGRNQNPYKECKIAAIKNDNGHIVRRLSGGGAVYHDLGNLNFTFLVRYENSNKSKQLNVILEALRNLGLNVQTSGRNDITIDEKKFSGNAFYRSKDYYYHHGTLLVDADTEKLSRYLNVSQLKLKSKGVNSVKSRVTNLKEYKKDLTIDMLKNALILSLSKTYKLVSQRIEEHELDVNKIKEIEQKFKSDDFIYPSKFDYEIEIGERFLWGEIQLLFKLKNNIIESVRIYSDALEEQFILDLSDILLGCQFSTQDLIDKIDQMPDKNELTCQMVEDIKILLQKL